MQQFRRERLPAADVRVAAQAEPFPSSVHQCLGGWQAQLGGGVDAVAAGCEPDGLWGLLLWVACAEMFSIHAQEPQQPHLIGIGIEHPLHRGEMQQQCWVLCRDLQRLEMQHCIGSGFR